MERWEEEVVCSSVYHCGPLGNCKKGKVPQRLLSKRTPARGPLHLPSATSPKVCLFQSWQQRRKSGGEKGNDCFTGRHWSIVNAACSFSWPVTCIVVGLLVWGGQTAGGTAGGLMDSWDNFGRERKKEREEKRVRAWEREGCERERERGISVWGKEEKRKEKGRAGEVTKVLSGPVCQPWNRTDTLLYTQADIWPVRKYWQS